jgi:hypothetical protein
MTRTKRILTALWRIVNTDAFVYVAVGLAVAGWFSHEGLPLNFAGVALIVATWPLIGFVAFIGWMGVLS